MVSLSEYVASIILLLKASDMSSALSASNEYFVTEALNLERISSGSYCNGSYKIVIPQVLRFTFAFSIYPHDKK